MNTVLKHSYPLSLVVLVRGEGAGWCAPPKVVQPKCESLGKTSHGGSHEKAKDRRGSGAVTLWGKTSLGHAPTNGVNGTK